MRIFHPAIRSSVYELAKVVELDVQIGDDSYSLRIELMRDTEDEHRFRCHVWELELFRLIPTFPMNASGQPEHISDDVLMVEREIAHRRINYPREDIVAPNVDAALEVVMLDIERFLEHATSEKAEWKQ